MADQPVSNSIAPDKATSQLQNEATASFSLIEDVYKPAANVGLETYNAVANAVNLVTPGDGIMPKAGLYDVRSASLLSPAWFGQTISGGLASGAVFAIGARGMGAALSGAAERFSLAGDSARLATSSQTSLLLTGVAFDGFRDVREGETRLTNIIGGSVAMTAFGQFNKFARELPTMNRVALQALGGSTGSLAQLAITDWSQGRSIDETHFWRAAIGGAVTNTALPVIQRKLGEGIAARSTRPETLSIVQAAGNRDHKVSEAAEVAPVIFRPSEPKGWSTLADVERLQLIKSLDKLGANNERGQQIVYAAVAGRDPVARTMAVRHISDMPMASQAFNWTVAWNKSETPQERRYVLGMLPQLSESVRHQVLSGHFKLGFKNEHEAIEFDTAGKSDTRGMHADVRRQLKLDAGKSAIDFLQVATSDIAPKEKRRLFYDIGVRSNIENDTSQETLQKPLPAPITEGRSITAKIKVPAQTTEVDYPAVEYDLPGHAAKLVIGSDLASQFRLIRQVRSDLLAGKKTEDTLANPLRYAALPEDYAHVLNQLPDRRLFDRVIAVTGRGVEPIREWVKKENAAGHVTRGKPDILIHTLRYNNWFTTVHFHEWAHRLEENVSKEASTAYKNAASRETYHLRDYGKEKGENLTVHGGEALLGPRSTFETAATMAPLRSAVFGKMLNERLIDLPPEMRSTMHGEWEDRIAYLERNIVPIAQRLAARELASARFANQSEPLNILSYIRQPGKSWLSPLRSDPPTEGLNLGFRPVDVQDGALIRTMQIKRLAMRTEDTEKVQAQPHITKLKINGNQSRSPFLTIPEGALAGLANFRSVEELTIQADSIPAKELNVLSQLPNLRKLTIEGDVGKEVMKALQAARSVEELHLVPRAKPITRDSLAPLATMENLQKLYLLDNIGMDALPHAIVAIVDHDVMPENWMFRPTY
jgi:hypothetical protein